MRRLLSSLAANKANYQEKFMRMYDFLKSFLNEQRLDEMAHAGYPLDKNVCDMLRAHRIEDEAQSNYFFDYLVQVPDANLDNLAEILSQKLMNWESIDNAENYQDNFKNL